MLAGATGQATTLLRPPYSSTPDALSNNDWRAAQHTGELGYLAALSTQDGLDWQSRARSPA